MERHTPLSYLRSRSPRTKHAIAFLGALLPALFVGYAQFYMRAKTASQELVRSKQGEVSPDGDDQHISAFAAFTKIFSEGKAAVGDATSALKQFNKEYLSDTIQASGEEQVLTPTQVQAITTE